MGGYIFSAQHLGTCKVYLKDLYKKKIIDSITLTSIKLPPLISSLGNLYSGKIHSEELAFNSHGRTWFMPNKKIHLCEHEIMLDVKSYTVHYLKKDTFYKLDVNSSIKKLPPNGFFEKCDIIIIDNIKTEIGGYDTIVDAPPIILAISPQDTSQLKFCKSDDIKYDFDSTYYGANYRLQKKKMDSSNTLQLCTKDSSHKLIFEEQLINAISYYKYCRIEK